MNILYGILTIMFATLFLYGAVFNNDFPMYKIFVARSKLLWKDKVHGFYVFVSIVLYILGVLFIANIF